VDFEHRLTTMSIAPKASTPAAINSSAAPGAVRSPPKTAVSPPISAAARAANSTFWPAIITFAPSAAKSSAIARPIPRAEPVTIAVLPSRIPIGDSD
jgi:hypothetical protein